VREVNSRVAAVEVVLPMGRDQDRDVGPPVERGPDAPGCLLVQRARGLIEQHDRWAPQKSACEGELLQHPCGTGIGPT
jgi:hypothetical protein